MAGKRSIRRRPTQGQLVALAGLKERLAPDVMADEPLSRHTTFGIGGPADLFVTARSRFQLEEFVRLAYESGVPYLVIGSGANLLVADRGVRGLVVQNACSDIEVASCEHHPGQRVQADSGCLLRQVAAHTMGLGLAGLEWAVDVPGSVGGAVVGNAGAFGGYTGDSLSRALVFEPALGERWWPKDELQMEYRSSYFKRRCPTDAPASVLLAAEFVLFPGDRVEIEARAEKNRIRRRETQPAGLCAGSVFKRTAEHAAGYLIEQAGLKGTRVGDAIVSTQHANFILNLGTASARDVRELIEIVRGRVCDRFQVQLDLEIELVGEW